MKEFNGYTIDDLEIFEKLQKNYSNTLLKLKWLKWHSPWDDEDWEESPIITIIEDGCDIIIANPRLGYEFCEKMLKEHLTRNN